MAEEVVESMIKTLSSLPGVGRKSAYRMSFFLLKKSETEFQSFIDGLVEAKMQLKFCEICFGFSKNNLCEICNNSQRKSELICVVEQPEDIHFIETTGEFRGVYHVLNGVISPLDNIGPDDLRIKDLLERVVKLEKSDEIEILLATNPTLEGDATASFISDAMKKEEIKVTRLAYGIAVGSSIELSDKYTLSRAIRARADF